MNLNLYLWLEAPGSRRSVRFRTVTSGPELQFMPLSPTPVISARILAGKTLASFFQPGLNL